MIEATLPPLREELSLYKGPRSKIGSPTWTIHDPSTNQFFHIGWLEFEILRRWNKSAPQPIIEAINSTTSLNIDLTHIENMLEFLALNSLLRITGSETNKRFSSINKRATKRDLSWLLHNYLFLRIPLVKPDRFLKRTYPMIRWLYSPFFATFLIFALCAGLYLSARQWDMFMGTFQRLFNLEGMMWYIVSIGFCKILHELGHAYTAHRYGCRVPSMGLMFLVLMPVLFTDTTESWKLSDHRKRLKIAASGMLTEMSLASIAILLWSLLPDSPARIAVFMVATSAWVITLAINLSPFMKFDGYYMLSDWFQIPNLQNRSFALGIWWVREKVFGFDDAPPEACSRKRQYGMIIYAISVWIYRFFLYIGIAYLVYKKFTKILGIILLMVEMSYFVTLPIIKELIAWWRLKEKMSLNYSTLRSLALLVTAISLLFIPWQSTVFLPATYKPIKSSTIYTNLPGNVDQIFIKKGQKVATGENLLKLSSLDLEYQISQIKRQIQIISWQLDRQGVTNIFRRQNMVLSSKLTEETSKLTGLEEERKQLIIKAPFAGWVKEMSEAIQINQTVSAKEPLLFLVADSGSIVEAFAKESIIKRLQTSMAVTFFPEIPEASNLSGKIIKIDKTATANLPDPYLASPLGGEIPARFINKQQLAPTNAIYRLRIDPTNPPTIPGRIVRGKVRVKITPESYARKIIRRFRSLIIRESGF